VLVPTADRTTIKAAVQALVAALRSGLTADPPTAAKPLRRVEKGPAKFGEYVRPFMTVSLSQVEPLASTEGDKIWRVSLVLRMVTDVLSGDPHAALLGAVAAVEDFFDGLLTDEDEVIEGADGFDDRIWTLGYPSGSTGSAAAEASCKQSFVVKVGRGEN